MNPITKDTNGCWQKTQQSKDMKDAVERRIKYAKEHGACISTRGQNDTVIARPIIIQMDRDTRPYAHPLCTLL